MSTLRGRCRQGDCWEDLIRSSHARKTGQTIRRGKRYMVNGEEHTISEWAEIVGISIGTIRTRIHKGEPIERVLRDLDEHRRGEPNTSPYTEEELYKLWQRFRDDSMAVQMLSDFMGGQKKQAASLAKKFKARYNKRGE